jgi:hypothetical protein
MRPAISRTPDVQALSIEPLTDELLDPAIGRPVDLAAVNPGGRRRDAASRRGIERVALLG